MHAYLIMAHDNFEQLKLLLEALDYIENDIYVHIDLKATDFDQEYLISGIKRTRVYFIKRISVTWGDYSLIECEMNLIEEASKKDYQYLHLLSGMDFPIKSHNTIVDFFNENNGKEFLHFEFPGYPEYEKYKIQYWFLLHKYVGRKKGSESIIAFIQWVLLKIQKVLKIDRTKKYNIKFYKGAQWFSITGEFAKYVLKQKSLIKQIFSYTCCGDEFFLQTVIMNSPYKSNIADKSFSNDYIGCLRMIDWNRGKPYTFTENDYDELVGSNFLFARKFDVNIDSLIVEKLSKL